MTKRETILQALFTLLSSVAGPTVLRNANLPERLPAGGIVKALQTNATRLVERPITWEDQAWLSFSPDGAVVLLS